MAKEFREEEHPRDKEGKFTDGVGTQAEQKRLEQMGISSKEKTVHNNLTNEEKRLQELTGGKVEHELTDEEKKKEKQKKYRQAREQQALQMIQDFKPVKIKIKKNGKLREIQAKFTLETAKENVYEYNRKTKDGKALFNQAGYKYKMRNLNELPQIVESSRYLKSKKEIGKNTQAHLDAKKWHYSKAEIKNENGQEFNALINIKETIKGEYIVYLVKISKKKKEPTK